MDYLCNHGNQPKCHEGAEEVKKDIRKLTLRSLLKKKEKEKKNPLSPTPWYHFPKSSPEEKKECIYVLRS